MIYWSTKVTYACSKSTIETLEKGVKYVNVTKKTPTFIFPLSSFSAY